MARFDALLGGNAAAEAWIATEKSTIHKQLPVPKVTTSPPRNVANLVGLRLWLHVDNWNTVSPIHNETPSGDVWITVTATASYSDWVFTAPKENAEGIVKAHCGGAGTIYTAGLDEDADGCGARIWRQTGTKPERVTVTWTVTGTSSEGPITPFTTTTVLDWEYRYKGTQAVER